VQRASASLTRWLAISNPRRLFLEEGKKERKSNALFPSTVAMVYEPYKYEKVILDQTSKRAKGTVFSFVSRGES